MKQTQCRSVSSVLASVAALIFFGITIHADEDPLSKCGKRDRLEYIAVHKIYDDIPPLAKEFLNRSTSQPKMFWQGLSSTHNDRAAAIVATIGSLENILIGRQAGKTSAGTTLLDTLKTRSDGSFILAGDRLYTLYVDEVFREWRKAGSRFVIIREDGKFEEGKVHFNLGGFGGSLHKGFSRQGFTTFRKIPRIQWNVRFCDKFMDIDLDGFYPLNPKHFWYANSDSRQWMKDYTEKFGPQSFQVSRKDHCADRISHGTKCKKMTEMEISKVQDLAKRFVQTLAVKGKFDSTVREFFQMEITKLILKDETASPLLPLCLEQIVRSLTPQEAMDLYFLKLNQFLFSDRSPEASSAVSECLTAASTSPNNLNAVLQKEITHWDEYFSKLKSERKVEANQPEVWLIEEPELPGLKKSERIFGSTADDFQMVIALLNDQARILYVVPSDYE